MFRAKSRQVPLLVVGPPGTVGARVVALDCGADDYSVMPVDGDKLLARIRAVLRRSAPLPTLRLHARGLIMDLIARTVKRNGRSLPLTVREFEVLKCSMQCQDETVSR